MEEQIGTKNGFEELLSLFFGRISIGRFFGKYCLISIEFV